MSSFSLAFKRVMGLSNVFQYLLFYTKKKRLRVYYTKQKKRTSGPLLKGTVSGDFSSFYQKVPIKSHQIPSNPISNPIKSHQIPSNPIKSYQILQSPYLSVTQRSVRQRRARYFANISTITKLFYKTVFACYPRWVLFMKGNKSHKKSSKLSL